MADLPVCSVKDCNKPVRARGYCRLHYERFMRHGDPEGGRTPNGEQMSHLLAHMWDDCPKWPYSRTQFGRGTLYDPSTSRHRLAHQVVCELVHGPCPTPGHEVAHTCGKGHEGCFGARCVVWKSRSENQMDRVAHGTSNRGSQHPLAKLSERDVLEILGLASTFGYRTLATRYGVTRECIRNIIRRRTWKWLTETGSS
jgi:hypothetical protein